MTNVPVPEEVIAALRANATPLATEAQNFYFLTAADISDAAFKATLDTLFVDRGYTVGVRGALAAQSSFREALNAWKDVANYTGGVVATPRQTSPRTCGLHLWRFAGYPHFVQSLLSGKKPKRRISTPTFWQADDGEVATYGYRALILPPTCFDT